MYFLLKESLHLFATASPELTYILLVRTSSWIKW